MLSFKELKKNLKKKSDSYPIINIALVGDTATQFLAIGIQGFGQEYGYNINLFEADYNQVERQLLDQTSELYSFNADYIIIFQSTHRLIEKHSMSSPNEQVRLADTRIDFITQLCETPKLRDKKLIYFNYPEIDDSIFGSYANKITSSLLYQTRLLNYKLMTISQQYPNFYICDIARIQSKFGRDFMFAPNVYASTEMVLSIDAIPYVSKAVMDIIAACQGRLKKCLITDLDNTLWGGVIGDDGIEGIQLGHGMGNGKVFTELQIWIKKLKQRGIILCVASKNDEDKAKEAFEKHPNMILSLEDFAVFQANWETKVDNIRTIQKILNIGFDSMVFLDDNPFERNIVKENIHDIAVPELPDDPSEYLEYLYSLNLFEVASYSNTDKDRTKQYQIEAKRKLLKKTFTNENEFLKSLQMISAVTGFTKFNIPRIAQLSQRSNQFNLRTVRYTETEIMNLANNPKVIGRSFTLEDKFGDNGLIAVVIMKEQNEDCLFIDTWFMSCRVLKRGMEYFILNTMVETAKQKGYKKIIGEYLPTAKNQMVASLYSSLGFDKMDETETAQYRLNIEDYKVKNCFINRK